MSREASPCPRCGAPRAASGAAGGLCPRCLMALGLEDDVSFVRTGGGPVPPPPPIEELRQAFPNLEIDELVGRGGMGAVYRARQPRLDRTVALKILRSDLAEDPAFAERFEREARTLARLSHPNIVAVHDAGRAGRFLYLLMEHVDGANLRTLRRAGDLASAEVLALVRQICDALQYAHDHGVVHRDIKPENVLIDTTGRVKIADFGLAKLTRPGGGVFTLTEPAQALGTVHYMAPEQLERPSEVDHRADIYALGVVFYELLTGELPLGRFDPPSQRVQVDVRLDEVVLKALAKEPQRRYQKASEVRTDVDRVSSAPAPSAAASEPAEPAPSGGGRREPPGDSSGRRRRPGAWFWYGVAAVLLFFPCCLGPAMGLAYLSRRGPAGEEVEIQARAEPSPPSPSAGVPRGFAFEGGPHLSATFLAEHAIPPDAARRADGVLASAFEDYLALEREHTTTAQRRGPNRIELEIAAFQRERAELLDATARELREALGADRWEEVATALDLDALLPYGAAGVRLAIARSEDEEGWDVSTTRGHLTHGARYTELPPTWRRLWEEHAAR